MSTFSAPAPLTGSPAKLALLMLAGSFGCALAAGVAGAATSTAMSPASSSSTASRASRPTRA